jgi:hypothetical protein
MRRWIAAAAGTLAALLLAGCTELPDGLDGDVTNGWTALPVATVFTPIAGTCHEELEPVAPVDTWDPVPCTELHTSETVAVATFGDDIKVKTSVPEPGSTAEFDAYRDCSKRVATFVGGPWRTGRIAVNVVLPSQAGWSGGARWYRCEITEVDLNTGRTVTREGTMARGLYGKMTLLLRCFNPTIAGSGVDRMTPVSCGRKHKTEFAGLWAVPKGISYDKLRGDEPRTARGCRAAIAKFAGIPDNSDVQYRTGWIAYHPTEDEWDRGERRVQCFLWLSGRSLTRSMKGAGTSGLPIQYR